MALVINHNIEIPEMRGRKPSDEHMALLTMPLESSFSSPKRREALYQLARSLAVKVTILPDTETEGNWRVWKKSHPGERKIRRTKKAALRKVES